MSGELAGRLRERVTISRAEPSGAVWSAIGAAWAELRPDGRGALFAGDARSALPAWRVTMRARDVAVGDRIGWGARTMVVREVRSDPGLPDRIVAIAEEER